MQIIAFTYCKKIYKFSIQTMYDLEKAFVIKNFNNDNYNNNTKILSSTAFLIRQLQMFLFKIFAD